MAVRLWSSFEAGTRHTRQQRDSTARRGMLRAKGVISLEYGSTKRKVNRDFIIETAGAWTIVHRIWPDGSTSEVLVTSSRADAHKFADREFRDLQRKRDEFDFTDDKKHDMELEISVEEPWRPRYCRK